MSIKFIFIFLLTVINFTNGCTINDVYSDSERLNYIIVKFSEIFDLKFDSLMQEILVLQPYLYCPGLHFKNEIKKLYISDGYVLNNIKDFEKVLNKLNYLNIQKFKIEKQNFEKFDSRKHSSVQNEKCEN